MNAKVIKSVADIIVAIFKIIASFSAKAQAKWKSRRDYYEARANERVRKANLRRSVDDLADSKLREEDRKTR